MEFQIDIVVEGPVESAFRACDSAKEQLSWIASLVEVRLDPERAWGVGATFVQVHEDEGRRLEFQGELLAYEPDRRIAMRLSHTDFVMETGLTFEDLGPRCRVRQETSLEVHGAILKAMRPLISAAVGARLREDFQRLKALIESAP